MSIGLGSIGFGGGGSGGEDLPEGLVDGGQTIAAARAAALALSGNDRAMVRRHDGRFVGLFDSAGRLSGRLDFAGMDGSEWTETDLVVLAGDAPTWTAEGMVIAPGTALHLPGLGALRRDGCQLRMRVRLDVRAEAGDLRAGWSLYRDGVNYGGGGVEFTGGAWANILLHGAGPTWNRQPNSSDSPGAAGGGIGAFMSQISTGTSLVVGAAYSEGAAAAPSYTGQGYASAAASTLVATDTESSLWLHCSASGGGDMSLIVRGIDLSSSGGSAGG